VWLLETQPCLDFFVKLTFLPNSARVVLTTCRVDSEKKATTQPASFNLGSNDTADIQARFGLKNNTG
jgi:hypothetical protein